LIAQGAGALTVHAPAKVNLALHVTGRRPDGYHLIETLAVFARFGDRLTLAPAERDSFEIGGAFAAGLEADDANLVLRARELLRHAFPENARQAVAISLQKNLPVASGLGGGSSDAAAALRGLALLWQLDIGEAELAGIGLSLGADLPMCLADRPVIARGIGERLTPVAGFPSLGMVLVNPGVPVATAGVFAALERRDGEVLPPLPGRLDFHTLCNWLETTRNDLEPAARRIEPAIGAALAALRKADAHFARMSGSGASCFGLYETGNVAKRAAAAIRTRHPGWFVAATRIIASEEHGNGQD
jgi:4-diphosphocytidyl-2-C-methyl-D-erythritol kinase